MMFALAAAGCRAILGIEDTVVGDAGADRDASAGATDAPPGDSYRGEVIADDPIGYWRLGEPAGALIADDEVGDLDGAAVGEVAFGAAGAVPNDANRAAAFDAIDDCIRVGDVAAARFDSAASFTIELWLRPDTVVGTARALVAKRGSNGTGSGQGYALEVFTESARLVVDDGITGEALNTPPQSIPTVAFVHLVATVDGPSDIATLYLDAEMVARRALTLQPMVGPSQLAIGCARPELGGLDLFDGMIDEVAIYDRALTDSDIARHHAAAAAP